MTTWTDRYEDVRAQLDAAMYRALQDDAHIPAFVHELDQAIDISSVSALDTEPLGLWWLYKTLHATPELNQLLAAAIPDMFAFFRRHLPENPYMWWVVTRGVLAELLTQEQLDQFFLEYTQTWGPGAKRTVDWIRRAERNQVSRQTISTAIVWLLEHDTVNHEREKLVQLFAAAANERAQPAVRFIHLLDEVQAQRAFVTCVGTRPSILMQRHKYMFTDRMGLKLGKEALHDGVQQAIARYTATGRKTAMLEIPISDETTYDTYSKKLRWLTTQALRYQSAELFDLFIDHFGGHKSLAAVYRNQLYAMLRVQQPNSVSEHIDTVLRERLQAQSWIFGIVKNIKVNKRKIPHVAWHDQYEKSYTYRAKRAQRFMDGEEVMFQKIVKNRGPSQGYTRIVTFYHLCD